MENKCILNALQALSRNVGKSLLNVKEKNAIMVLLDKLIKYYNIQRENISKTTNFYVARNKDFEVSTTMTDYIVAVNDSINGRNDVFSVVNSINRKINVVEKKKFFKVKRLTT
jgi:hypothetical protein